MHKKLQSMSKEVFKTFQFYQKSDSIKFLHRRFYSSRTAQSNLSYYHHIGPLPLIHRTVGDELQRAVTDFGTNEAIVSCHEQKRYTFKKVLELADRIGAGLLKLGLQQGDHVGIWGPNNLRWYLTMLGCARAGLVSVGLNPALQGPEVEYCLRWVKVKAVVAAENFKTQNYYEILSSIFPDIPTSTPGNIMIKDMPWLRTVIIDTPQTPLPGTFNFDQLLGFANVDEVRSISSNQKNISPDTPCNIQFTSGTTGDPKAAMLSHFSFINNGFHVGSRNQYEGQRICVQVPLFHAFGVIAAIMAGMSHGATMVLPCEGFNPEESLHAIINEHCTLVHGTPTMYVDLVRKQRELQLPLKSLKTAITGGAPCSPALFQDIKNVLGLERVSTIYGLTEATAVMFQSCSNDTPDQVTNTVGHVQDHLEAKVVDSLGNTVPFGQPGELWIRGYLTMLGYYGNEMKTKETLGADKWLRTGDQFVLEENGYGRIVGRLKDVIIRGGENLFPKEIEDFLNSHPDIIETHVVGVPDDRLGEEICAFVRLKDGIDNITREEIKKFSKGKIAHFKVPRYVVPVDQFPKTVSGKIQKFKLEDLFEKMQDQKRTEE